MNYLTNVVWQHNIVVIKEHDVVTFSNLATEVSAICGAKFLITFYECDSCNLT